VYLNSYRTRQIGGVAAVVGLLLIGIVFGVTQFLKSRKGSLAIAIEHADIRDGGKVSGLVNIKPRQDLNAQRLTLKLVCQESWEEVRLDRDGYEERRTESRERHAQTLTIRNTLELAAGQDQAVPFEVQLPATIPKAETSRSRRSGSSYGGTSRRQWSRRAGRLRWHLSATLELDGLDLDASHHF
jgi:hypothetical protein